MKRIMFCLNGPNHLNGPNVWLTRHIPLLQECGLKPEILYLAWNLERECQYRSHFESQGVKVTCVEQRGFLESKVEAIVAAVSGDLPEYFVPNYSIPAYYASRFLREAGVTTVGTLHSDDPYYHDIVDVFVTGSPTWRLSALVGVSDLITSWVVERKIQLPYLFATYGAPVPEDKAAYDGKLLRLIYCGRLAEHQKRIHRVAERMLEATDAFAGVCATIYGTGEEEEALEARLRTAGTQRTKLGGSLTSRQMQAAMLDSHVFVLLSDFEGLSIALMEAMACGLVPIVSDMRSGIRDVITDGVNGFIVDPDDPAAFQHAVQVLHSNPETWRRMSAAARQTILDLEFTPESCAKKWCRFLQEVRDSVPAKNHITSPLPLPPFREWGLPKVSKREKGIGEHKRMIHVLRVATDRPIYLWGAGSYGRYLLRVLREKQVPVVGVIDSSTEKQGSLFEGLPIVSLKAAGMTSGASKPYVVLATSYYREVIDVLVEQGYEQDQDFV